MDASNDNTSVKFKKEWELILGHELKNYKTPFADEVYSIYLELKQLLMLLLLILIHIVWVMLLNIY